MSNDLPDTGLVDSKDGTGAHEEMYDFLMSAKNYEQSQREHRITGTSPITD